MAKKIFIVILCCSFIFFLFPTRKLIAAEDDKADIARELIIAYIQSTTTIIRALENYDILTSATILMGKGCQSKTFNYTNVAMNLKICPFSFHCAGVIKGVEAAGFKISDKKIGNTIYYFLEMAHFQKMNSKADTRSSEFLIHFDRNGILVMDPDSLETRIIIANLLEILADFDQ